MDKSKLESLSYEWSLIDGQGLVRVVTISNYRAGIELVAHIGAIAEVLQCLPELTLSREKLVVTIADSSEAAYALAGRIDELLVSDATDAS